MLWLKSWAEVIIGVRSLGVSDVCGKIRPARLNRLINWYQTYDVAVDWTGSLIIILGPDGGILTFSRRVRSRKVQMFVLWYSFNWKSLKLLVRELAYFLSDF